MVDIEVMKPKYMFFMENWHADSGFMCRISGQKRSMPKEEVFAMIGRWLSLGYLTFIVKHNEIPVGYINIQNITINDSAEIHLCLYTKQGIGIMPRATKKVLDFAFDKMNLNRILAMIPENRKDMIRMLNRKPYGFRFEGIQRDYLKVDNTYKNVHFFGLLKKDYEEGRVKWEQV